MSSAPASTPVATPPPRASAAASVDPERTRQSANRLDEKAAALEAKAEKLEAEAAACDETKRIGRLDAKNKRSMARRYRSEAGQKRSAALRYREAAGDQNDSQARESDSPGAVTFDGSTGQHASPYPQTPDTPDLAEQLLRLTDLHGKGALSAEEFVEAKRRLLG